MFGNFFGEGRTLGAGPMVGRGGGYFMRNLTIKYCCGEVAVWGEGFGEGILAPIGVIL